MIAYFCKRFISSQQHHISSQQHHSATQFCLAMVISVTHWRSYVWRRHVVCAINHIDLCYLYFMQDTSNILTRWAIALQSYDCTVGHKPGRLDIIPDTLSRLFNFGHSKMRLAPHLASIRRNVPDNSALHGSIRLRPYQVISHYLDKI